MQEKFVVWCCSGIILDSGLTKFVARRPSVNCYEIFNGVIYEEKWIVDTYLLCGVGLVSNQST